MYAFTALSSISIVASYYLKERPLKDLTADESSRKQKD